MDKAINPRATSETKLFKVFKLSVNVFVPVKVSITIQSTATNSPIIK